jgi:hypothetical protein
MGKGKGALSRYCSRILHNHNLLEFSGFNLHEIFVLKKILKKKVNIPTKIIGDFFKNKNIIVDGRFNENFFFFKKYQK